MSVAQRTLKAPSPLRIPRFRRYTAGIVLSSLGTWVHVLAQAWLVLDLRGQGAALGIVTGSQFLPLLVLGLFTGSIADRVNRASILSASHFVNAVSAVTVATLFLSGHASIIVVVAGALLFGLAIAFDGPARLSVIGDLVDEDLIPSAVAFNSIGFNAARFVGPAIGGALVGVVGAARTLLVAASCYGLAGALFASLRTNSPRERSGAGIRSSLRYIRHEPTLRSTLVAVAIVGAFALNFALTIPVLVRFGFGAGADRVGAVMSAMGAGAVTGGLALVRRGRPERRMPLAAAGLGIGLVALAYAPTLLFAGGAAAVCGFCTTTFLASSNARLQMTADPGMRGRVIAVYLVAYLGSTPVGAPPLGWLADRIGASAPLIVGAAACLAVAAVLFKRRAEL